MTLILSVSQVCSMIHKFRYLYSISIENSITQVGKTSPLKAYE